MTENHLQRSRSPFTMDRFVFERRKGIHYVRVVADYDSEHDYWLMTCKICGEEGEFDRRFSYSVYADAQDMIDIAMRHVRVMGDN